MVYEIKYERFIISFKLSLSTFNALSEEQWIPIMWSMSGLFLEWVNECKGNKQNSTKIIVVGTLYNN